MLCCRLENQLSIKLPTGKTLLAWLTTRLYFVIYEGRLQAQVNSKFLLQELGALRIYHYYEHQAQASDCEFVLD